MQSQARGISGSGQSNNPFASASLYVGDLISECTEATLFELFNAVGPVASIRVCRDATTRRSLGYAYVNFHSVQDAERALDTMNFTNIRGKQCRIMWSQRDPRLRQSGKGNIFVKNLHESIDNKTLYDTFSVFGNILSCKVVIDKESQKSRGYGYVHYVDDKSAKKAIEGVNGMTISNRQVHAELFKPREERLKTFKYTNVYVKYIPKTWTEEILKKIFEEATGGIITKLYLWRHEYGISACLNFADPDRAKVAVDKLNGKDVKSFDIPQDLLNAAEQDDDDEKKQDLEAGTKGAEDKEEESVNKPSSISIAGTDSADKSRLAPPIPSKLYVARAQKRKERKEYLARQQRRRGVGSRRNYSGANLYVKNLSPDVDDDKLNDMFRAFGNITSAKVMKDATGKSRGFGFVAFEKKEAATRAIHEMTNTLHHGKPLYVARAQTKAFRTNFIQKQLRRKQIQTRRNNNNYNKNYNNNNIPNTYGGPPGPYAPGPGPQSYGGPMQNQYNTMGGAGMGPQQQQQQQQQFNPMGQQSNRGRGGRRPGRGRGNPQNQMGQQGGFNTANPNIMAAYNPGLAQQMATAQIQQMATAQQLAQQRLAQQQALQAVGGTNQAQLQALQAQQLAQAQMSSIQQQAVAANSMQMSSIRQTAAHQSATQTSQPAPSMQSGPQSTSMYTASVPRQGVGSGAMVGVTSANIASQPHQSSVPTGQHSVSQISAGQTSAPMLEVNPLTSEMLQDAKPAEKKRLIGERLFPKIQVVEPRLAGKITGMLLEMDNTELLVLLSDQRALMNKINEALAVLKDHQQKQSQQNPSSQNPGGGSAQN